jgi:hypothetical protein
VLNIIMRYCEAVQSILRNKPSVEGRLKALKAEQAAKQAASNAHGNDAMDVSDSKQQPPATKVS